MILHDGRTFAIYLRNRTPVTSFSIFFRPGMAEDVARVHALAPEVLLADPGVSAGAPIEFSEQVRPHDRLITRLLHFATVSMLSAA